MGHPTETPKLKSLPSDLRLIADNLIAEKFGLAKSGEVTPPKNKAKPKMGEGVVGWIKSQTTTNNIGSALTEDSINKAVEAMERHEMDAWHYNTMPMYMVSADFGHADPVYRGRPLEGVMRELSKRYPEIAEWVENAEYSRNVQGYVIRGKEDAPWKNQGTTYHFSFVIPDMYLVDWDLRDIAKYIAKKLMAFSIECHDAIIPERGRY